MITLSASQSAGFFLLFYVRGRVHERFLSVQR